MSNVPFNSTFTWSLLQKFLFEHEYSVFLTIGAGLEIATHWSLMRPKIEHWRLNFQNWSPAGSYELVHVHTSVLYKKANDPSCERGYSSVVMRMGDWLRVLHNHGNMLVFLFNQAGLTKPKKYPPPPHQKKDKKQFF